MADAIRFHLDENVDAAIARGLQLRGIDATTSVAAGLRGSDDLQHIEFALREGRVLVTHDDDFLRLHASGVEHMGLVYCHPVNSSIGEVVRGLVLIYECMTPQEMRQHVEFL